MTIKNFRVGGLVVILVVDSVAVNIRKSLNFFTPFESSKLGRNSYHPLFLFRNFILSALFVLDKMYEIGIYPVTISPLLFSVRKSVETKKKNKTNFALGRIDIFIEERERKRKQDFQEEIYP